MTITLAQVLITFSLAVPVLYIYSGNNSSKSEGETDTDPEADNDADMSSNLIPSTNNVVPLPPPKDDPFTLDQLKEFDGTDSAKPIYISIKGTVYDVSNKRDTYGPNGSYHIFAGKDPSRALGKSTLKGEDAVADYSTLTESERKVLDDWHSFYAKKYPVVGRVTDLPDVVKNL